MLSKCRRVTNVEASFLRNILRTYVRDMFGCVQKLNFQQLGFQCNFPLYYFQDFPSAPSSFWRIFNFCSICCFYWRQYSYVLIPPWRLFDILVSYYEDFLFLFKIESDVCGRGLERVTGCYEGAPCFGRRVAGSGWYRLLLIKKKQMKLKILLDIHRSISVSAACLCLL